MKCIYIGDNLMHIISVNLRNFVIAAKSFVLSIQNEVVLVKIGIAHTAMVVKQVDATFM